MAEFTAQDVKALRDATGAGMMDAKKALIEADGDRQKAAQVLRQKGLTKVATLGGRKTTKVPSPLRWHRGVRRWSS